MAFVSTILISNDAMWWVTKMFEGQFILWQALSGIVAFVVALVSVMFVLHGLLAMRKFPANYHEYKISSATEKCCATRTPRSGGFRRWTGFALFFSLPFIFTRCSRTPATSAPTSRRIECGAATGGRFIWFLLFAVELHGGVGLYRLAVKWGWFEGEDPNRTRMLLKRLKWGITVFFLALGTDSPWRLT